MRLRIVRCSFLLRGGVGGQTAGAMKWTVLCPNWYMSNHLGDIFGTLPNSIIAYPLKSDAKATIVDPRDVGDLAASLLVAPDPTVYHALKLDVNGPEAISLGEIAALYTEALKRPVQPVECSKNDWVAGAIGGGLEEWLAHAVTHNFDRWAAGDLLLETSPEARAASAPKRTMAQWIKEWAPRSPPPAGP